NVARRALRLSRRLADRPLGPTPLAAAFQRALAGWLRFGFVLAALAGAGAGRFSVFGLERVVTADDVYRCGHIARSASAHDGHRRAVNDPSRAHDARPAIRGLAGRAVRLDVRRPVGAARLHPVGVAHRGVSVVHGRTDRWQLKDQSSNKQETIGGWVPR